MRPDHLRLGILAVVTLFVCPCAALAQATTSTDAAIAELRQLLAEQRAALDRQARIIEEQGRTLAALQQRVEAANRSTGERREPGAPASTAAAAAVVAQAPVPAAAGKPYGCRATPDLPARSSRPESSQVRSAFRGPSRPSSSAARREWSPFTR